MKLNIVFSPADVREGYLNAGPVPGDDRVHHVKTPAEIRNLVAPGEADEVVCLDGIDRVPQGVVNELLHELGEAVAVGGTLALGCVDLLQVAFAVTAGSLPVVQAGELLHGTKDNERFASYYMAQLADAATNLGLTVVHKRHHGMRAVVVAERR